MPALSARIEASGNSMIGTGDAEHFEMAFVPGFEHDIFVSYAHVDDQPAPGVEHGWVTTLVKIVQLRLDALLGRKRAHSLWMDHSLAQDVRFSEEIMRTLQNTATLLIVLSPGYVASEWCDRERRTFMQLIRQRLDADQRVFVVQRDVVEDRERPEELKDVRGYQFWEYRGKRPRILGDPKPRDDDEVYFEKVDDLARDIAKQLKLLKGGAESGDPDSAPAVEPVNDRHAVNGDRSTFVYLAEVTDELDGAREEVKRYLDQQGYGVLPERWYPREADAFQQELDRDLAGCSLYAQLLDHLPGKRFQNSTARLVDLQYQRALASGKPILQWRPPTLNLAQIDDNGQRALLEAETVLSVDLEQFKKELLLRLERGFDAAETSPAHDSFVFVDFSKEDEPEANRLCELLERHGVGYARPMHAGAPHEVRRDLMANFKDCDALIMIYGCNPLVWVREHLRLWLKTKRRRQRPPRALAVCETPPTPKTPLNFRLPEMKVIDCCGGFNEQQLAPFLRSLVTG
jgi:hypothetical protein